MGIKRLKKIINENNSFLITSHVNPEGDSICSQLAMYQLLRGMGKKAFIFDSDPPPKLYRFLPFVKKIGTNLRNVPDYDVAVVIDCPVLERTGRVARLLGKGKKMVNIDHHVSNVYFGDANWVNYKASSCGEMIYELFRAFKQPVNKKIALLLYISILTDTGSFGYENTSARTHLIAKELLEKGLRPVEIRNRIYESRSFAELKLLQKALSTLKIIHNGKIAYLCVTKKMLDEADCEPGVTEGFINFARSIESIKVALLFLESPYEPHKIQISFRGKGEIDVNRLASHFNGGGHKNAAGCLIKGSLKFAMDKVLGLAKKKV